MKSWGSVVGGLEQSRACCQLGDTTGLPDRQPCLPGLRPHHRADMALWGVLQVVGHAKGRTTGSQGSLGHPGESQSCSGGGNASHPPVLALISHCP